MNNTAEIIKFQKFERPVVKADTDEGFIMLANSINSELGKFGIYRLNGRERAMIDCIIDKTFKYKKKTDWISESQFSEFMGLSDGSTGNINKIKNSLIKRKILISEGRKVGINTTLSEWTPFENQSKTTGMKTSQKRFLNQSNSTAEQSKTTEKQVKNNPHNIKTIIQKTITTIDKPATKKSTSKIPLDFSVTTDMQSWALENQISVNLKTETEQFIDHYTAKGESRADWVASWRTWMRNSKKFSPAKQSFSAPKTFRDITTDRNREVFQKFLEKSHD